MIHLYPTFSYVSNWGLFGTRVVFTARLCEAVAAVGEIKTQLRAPSE